MKKFKVEIIIKKFRYGIESHIEFFETKEEAMAYIEYMKKAPHFMGSSLSKCE